MIYTVNVDIQYSNIDFLNDRHWQRLNSLLSSQLAGGVVMAVGVWTLIEKTDYISLLPSMTYAASAYILVLAGVIVMVTGVLGCCATFKEHRKLLRVVRDHVMLARDDGG